MRRSFIDESSASAGLLIMPKSTGQSSTLMVPGSDLVESIQVPMAEESQEPAAASSWMAEPVVLSESMTNSMFLDLPPEVCVLALI